MARTDPSFNLRIPLPLKEKLEIEAKNTGRTVTAEIIKRLEDSFAPNKNYQNLAVHNLVNFVERLAKNQKEDDGAKEVSFYISDEEKKILDELVSQSGMSRSDYIKMTLLSSMVKLAFPDVFGEFNTDFQNLDNEKK